MTGRPVQTVEQALAGAQALRPFARNFNERALVLLADEVQRLRAASGRTDAAVQHRPELPAGELFCAASDRAAGELCPHCGGTGFDGDDACPFCAASGRQLAAPPLRSPADALLGMAWWNALSRPERLRWLQLAGSDCPADAWAAYQEDIARR